MAIIPKHQRIVYEAYKNKPPRFIIGIDPGFSGAIAVMEICGVNTSSNTNIFDSNNNPGPHIPKTLTLLAIHDMPILPESAANDRPKVSPQHVAAYVQPYLSDRCDAFVERVSASPQMGVVSAFRFGEGYGAVHGVLETLAIPTKGVAPAVWKAGLGLSANKRASLKLIRELFPSKEHWFRLVKDNGRAEACLIAYYAYKSFLQNEAPVGEIRNKKIKNQSKMLGINIERPEKTVENLDQPNKPISIEDLI